MEGIRDLLILHSHLNERSGDPLWNYCRHMSPPDTLSYRMEHFKRSGRSVLGSDELFREASWLSVLIGQGLRPSGYAPLTDTLPSDDNLSALRRLQGDIRDVVRNLPPVRAASRPDSAAKSVN
jgi:tryptophan halogenase